MNKQNISLYVHWPFCKSKCPYCDFNSHVQEAGKTEDWLQAFKNELEHFSPNKIPLMEGKKIKSIFFGGGTPSLMPPEVVEGIIKDAEKKFGFTDNIEITLEANPTSIEAAKFKAFKQAGVNRVSIGVQALNAADLKFLGREHDVDEAKQAIGIAANTFDNYSFDLIYARPQQTVEAWVRELEEAISFGIKHLSLYQLTIEKGTKFYGDHAKGAFSIPDGDYSAELYLATDELMTKNKMPAYEISNYAKRGFECMHNLQYWEYGEYIGIGAGAHGRVITGYDGKTEIRNATMMWHEPQKWLKTALDKKTGLQTNIELTKTESMEEMLMMGLRLTEGIRVEKFKEMFGEYHYALLNQGNLKMLINEKLLEDDGESLKATKQGLMLLQQVTSKLLS